jgi:hypothetical protein
MTKLHRWLTLLLVVGLLWEIGRSARPPETAMAEDLPSTTLSLLRAEPTRHLGQTLRVVFVVQSRPERWNSYLTRFGLEDYRALEVWGDEQFLWDPEAFTTTLGLVFARRGQPIEAWVDEARPFERYEAVACVRQAFLGRPWIEISEMHKLDQQVGEGSLIHASRAVALMLTGEWPLAQEDLQRALADERLPEHQRAELERLAAVCAEALAQPERRTPRS